ncbi:PAS domain-containing sensor histidine kinase [uncultured Deefgea sp.]|uniref:sensor histidine kinase n=1 Tax=uncultured Deefgea sp. TaxID=1304914 RepID=UPI00261783F6|nr:HAMP domain-containing sensor histidine kinase [uncultured Deefgea sp.]
MSLNHEVIDPKNLEQAFALFTAASEQLSIAYAELQDQVTTLTEQLEVANGNLRREFEEKSALSRRLSLLLDRLPAGVLELDQCGDVLTQNAAAKKLLGRSDHRFNWSVVMAEQMQATDEPGVLAYQSGDNARHLLLEEVDVPEEGIRLVLLHDVTAATEMRRALSRHQRLVEMGEMAAGLAHQLRTPLATALLYSGHLVRVELSNEDRVRFAQKSLERLRHLEVLIQNMLRFVRGQQQFTERLDVSGVLLDAIQHVQPQFDAKNVALHWVSLNMPVWTKVNAREFSGAIANLLENALQASVSGQSVVCSLSMDVSTLEIEIKDFGCGMSEATCIRLFEPFFTTRKDGTGLGLAIVRNLVSAYGGGISVESKLDFGSSFKIRLPLTTATTKV